VLASKRVGPNGTVVAFEPDPENIERMRRNAGLNPGLAMTIEEVAISDCEGEATFRRGGDSAKGSLLDGANWEGRQAFTVPTTTLDSYVNGHGIDRVDVLKIDIEGAEPMALEGMAEGLGAGRYGSIILEWHGDFHQGLADRPGRALSLLDSSGYKLFVIRRRHWRPKLEPVRPEAVGEERIHLLCQRVE